MARPLQDFHGLDAKIAKALDTYATGVQLDPACKEQGINRQTAVAKIYRSTGLYSLYTRARELHLESRLQQLDQIVRDEPDPRRARLLCENIQWQAERVLRKTYGNHNSLEVIAPSDPRTVPEQIAALERILGIGQAKEEAKH